MQLMPNPEMEISVHHVGNEQSPIMVVDNFLLGAELLVEHACQLEFIQNSPLYPGLRAQAPLHFQSMLLSSLGRKFKHVFDLKGTKLALSLCQYSLVTFTPEQLTILQRIPHFDSTQRDELAAVYYLFQGDLGGTSFYRHNKTGFENIDDERRIPYFKSLEAENEGDDVPQHGYINGDTPLFTRIGEQKGIFNRLVIYRRQILHSGSISSDFIPDSNPRTGRLTLNIFIDCI